MATAILSPGLTELRGRQGGTIFYRDPRGPEYVRLRSYNPHPHRQHLPAQQHTNAGMQSAMLAYRMMLGGIYESAWQALALAQTPPSRTIDFFCKRQLLAWKLDVGPSLDPTFPDFQIPSYPAGSPNIAFAPAGSHGFISYTVDYTGAPLSVPQMGWILCQLDGAPQEYGMFTSMTAFSIVSSHPYTGGFRIRPGTYQVGFATSCLDGTSFLHGIYQLLGLVTVT